MLSLRVGVRKEGILRCFMKWLVKASGQGGISVAFLPCQENWG